MGLMDSLKKASGLGLSPDEHYQRAYEKGVLLGPEHYGKAIELFEAAARKAQEGGDARLEIRARANAAFYGFVTTGSRESLATLRRALEHLPDIEQIGSRTDMLPAAPLIGVSLVTYRYHSPDRHKNTGDERFFLHQGLAHRYEAMQHTSSDPETAAEKMAKALSSFRQCADEPLATEAEAWVKNLRQQRTCWLCHREFQGFKVHFDVYAARVTAYAEATVTRLGQDTSAIDRHAGTVVLCGLCASGITNISDSVAEEKVGALRTEVQDRLAHHERVMSALIDRIERLERKANLD